MDNEQNKNALDTEEDVKKTDKANKIKEDDKHTVHDDKELLAENNLMNKITSLLNNSLTASIAVITGIIGSTALFYESYIIPKRNYDDKAKIQILEQENNFLKDTSELVSALRENKKLREENTHLFEKQKQLNNLVVQNKQLKDNLEQWKKSQESWQEAYNKVQNSLSICSNNFNIQKEINLLREKIEKNNRDIRDSGFHGYNPSEIKFETINQDNIQLNNMILKYQDKIQCSNP